MITPLLFNSILIIQNSMHHRTIGHNLLLGWATTTICASETNGDNSKIEHVGSAPRSAALHTGNHRCYIRGSTETAKIEVRLQEYDATSDAEDDATSDAEDGATSDRYHQQVHDGSKYKYFEVPNDGDWGKSAWECNELILGPKNSQIPKNFVLERKEWGKVPPAVYGVAIDWKHRCLHFAVNGQWRYIPPELCNGLFEQEDGSAPPRLFPAVSCENGTISLRFNFGDREFKYPPLLPHRIIKKCHPMSKAIAPNLPLLAAAMNSHFQVVDLLLDRSNAIAEEALKRKRGCDAEASSAAGNFDNIVDASSGFHLLHYLACSNQASILKKLPFLSSIVDKKTLDGKTALMWASLKGHKDVVQALLEAKADKDMQDEGGETALMIASRNGHKDIVQALLEAEADKDMQGPEGWTALMIASQAGHEEIVRLLEAA